MNRHVTTTALALLCATSVGAQSSAPSLASDADIRKVIVERVDIHRQSVGIVVGVIESSGRRVITYGKASTSEMAPPLDGDTVFEIGSMTKVFTSLLLADAVQRAEVGLTDPIAKYLPPVVKVPERGRAITLQDLANHTSGLPRTPTNMNPKDTENPYADYSVDQLYQFLSANPSPLLVVVTDRGPVPASPTCSMRRVRCSRGTLPRAAHGAGGLRGVRRKREGLLLQGR